jgi:hypothetical protein
MFHALNGDSGAGIGYNTDLAVTMGEISMQSTKTPERSKSPLLLTTRRDRKVRRVIGLLLVQP